MAEEFGYHTEVIGRAPQGPSVWKTVLIHSGLFLLTFFTTTMAGVGWLNRNPLELTNFSEGLTYSVLLLLMLSTHEFGHYFAARRHGVSATLPYFIPFPSVLGVPFGTFGAVIKIRSAIPSRKAVFDIGAAGPIAGFVVSLLILVIGFITLPSKEYLYEIHPEYASLSGIPEGGLKFGTTLLYAAVAEIFSPPGAFVPPMNEIYHYPFLCVGWFGLFVTALNLIPVGQLDGGHISFAMFGERSRMIGRTALIMMIVAGLAGFLPEFGIDFPYGYVGWLTWAFIMIFFLRAMKSGRPPLADDTPLDPTRTMLGWICFGIFVSCFSLAPLTVSDIEVLF
jgi:membrane-associated protease RseP (regulator of RpoE activity)